MAQLTEELRKLFLLQDGIEVNNNTIQRQAKVARQARDIFETEINPLFSRLWGEIWHNHLRLNEEGANGGTKMLWITMVHGFSIDVVAKAIIKFCDSGNPSFPPNPLQFRAICSVIKKENSKEIDDKNKKTLSLLN